MKHIVDIFSALGERLTHFGSDENSNRIMEEAIAANGWFTRVDILRAVEAIRVEMLDRTKLENWLKNYTRGTLSKRVAVIMAGNIPLVGFFDLLCVLAAGHECHLKPSSKDSVLMRYVVDQLRDIDPNIAICDYSADAAYDMAIATGGDDANVYFREHFAGTRTLLRGSRHSVAVLSGRESAEDLRALYNDITAYSGLGCRSVSMLFVPQGYVPAFERGVAENAKLKRNVQAMRATLTIEGAELWDAGAFIMRRGEDFAQSLAVVTIREYADIESVKAWLNSNAEHIQCVVSNMGIEGSQPLGRAQYPALMDYADGVDTMRFLLG
ncbi:MAG: aldehyde dehydrogenase [Alistipes sp.]|nr:aldehyde dehydrogenase [Alistipes sp.]